MNTPQLETKRRPIGRLPFRRVHAQTIKRQRVAATADQAGDLQGDVPNVGVARALVIILCLHIVAIAGIFFHNRYFERDATAEPAPQAKAVLATASESRIGPRDEPYVVQPGDTYDRIAGQYDVGADALRTANSDVPLRAGRILRIPPRRIVAVESAELSRRRDNAAGAPGAAPDAAVLVRPAARPAASPAAAAGTAASGDGYVVRAGDTVWRLANRFGVSQDVLMKANGIDDPNRLRAGMELRIPSAH